MLFSCADRSAVRIYEHLPRVLYANKVSIDCEWAVLGTANLDDRSFFLNYELAFTPREPRFCQRIEQSFEADLGESPEVTAERWPVRRWPAPALEGIGWALRRWL